MKRSNSIDNKNSKSTGQKLQTNRDHLETDLILLGTQSSGKTTVLKLLTQGYTPDMYHLPRVTGTEITKTQMEGFKINVREMSWNLVKSWPSVYRDSKIMIFLIDGTDETTLSQAYIELLSVLKNFDRPVALLFNKCDILSNKTQIYETFRLAELKLAYPGLLILPYSAFVSSDIDLLKDWLESVFELFGIKNIDKGSKKGIFGCFSCCGGKSSNKSQVQNYVESAKKADNNEQLPMVMRAKTIGAGSSNQNMSYTEFANGSSLNFKDNVSPTKENSVHDSIVFKE